MKRRLLAMALCTALVAGCGSDNNSTATDDGQNSGDDSGDQGSGDGGGNDTDNNDTDDNNGDGDNSGDVDNNTDDGDSGDGDNNGDGDGSGTGDNTDASPPSGLLDTAQPTFVWPAVANAQAYKIVVKDAGNSGYARALDPVAANCQTGEGMCSATTALAYYDNDLSWNVESTVNGAPGPVSETYTITTPLSENMQPIKSSDGNCEAWAAVAYDKYVVLNNAWNAKIMSRDDWSQVINVTENANGTVTPAWAYDWKGQFDTNVEFGEFQVRAYPEVLYGPKLGTHVSGTKEETGLPELVSDLPEFVVTYDYSETFGDEAERNVALESFFHDSSDIRGPCDFDENGNKIDNRVYEMMIWVNNPTIRTPGSATLTGVMIDNQLWDVYTKPVETAPYIAFTAHNPSTSGTLNWKRFVDWTVQWTAENAEALNIAQLKPEYHMGAIEIGTEMWWGDGTFTLNRFDVTF